MGTVVVNGVARDEDDRLMLYRPKLDTVEGDMASSEESPSSVALALANASNGSSSSS